MKRILTIVLIAFFGCFSFRALKHKDVYIVHDPALLMKRLVLVGKVNVPSELAPIIPLYNAVITESGTASYTADQVKNTLKKYAAKFDFSLSEDGRLAAGFSCFSHGFSEVTRIFLEIIKSSNFDSDTVEMKKKILCENLRRNLEKPFNMALIAVKHFLFSDDRILNCDRLLKFDRQDLIKFHNSLHFLDFRIITNFENFDENTLLTHIKKKYGNQIGDSAKPTLNQTVVIWIWGPFDQYSTVLAAQSENLLSPKRYALRLFSSIISEDFDSLVFKKIRSELGLAYVADAGWLADFKTGTIYLAVQHSADKLEEVLRIGFEIFHDVKSGAFDYSLLGNVIKREKRKLSFEKERLFAFYVERSLKEVFGLPWNDQDLFLQFLANQDHKTLVKKIGDVISLSRTSPFVLVVIGKEDPYPTLLKTFGPLFSQYRFVKARFDENFRLLY
ncbi:MAG: hypothetical protein N2654_01105 [Deltaproteobacteria bacterium]|nr:hypothetical protein [Deltaproteobacteria bacterium]